ncbi:MAG: glycoside hydrolase family 5 protein [Fibrobacteres bacterium]|nr:glycoside hydrolase family 5 protein [Fibrobacterota bacterium]
MPKIQSRPAGHWRAGAWIAALLLAVAAPSGATPVQQYGLLSVKGNRIVDKNGNPVALRGMSLYCWSTAGTQFYNANTVNWLVRDWKCNIIRIAILPGSYQGNPTGEINKVKTVVDACIANGIYAVVDWHSMDGAQNNVQSSKNFFTDLAKAYGTTPNIMYETWNEPMQESWATQIKPYHEAVIQAIRAVDPDNIIICGTRNWSQDMDEASKNPITISTNIAYTMHYYAATHKQALRDKATTALKNGIALMVTEYGTAEATGSGFLDAPESHKWWDFLDQNFISSCNWSVAALGETTAALKPGASAAGGWTAANLSPSGTLVRDEIRAKNPDPTGIALSAPSRRAALLAFRRAGAEWLWTGGGDNSVLFVDARGRLRVAPPGSGTDYRKERSYGNQ